MKKIISVLLCAILVTSSILSVNAAELSSENREFVCTGETLTMEDNTFMVFANGIDTRTYNYCISYQGFESGKKYEAEFKKSLHVPQRIRISAADKYARYIVNSKTGGYSGNIYAAYSFSKTGGEYKKVRVKLSDVSTYFNEDGTHTETVRADKVYKHDFKFCYEDIGNRSYYDSYLIIVSGGAVTAVVPDENGMVEFYMSTDIDTPTQYTTGFYKELVINGRIYGGSDGGTTNSNISALRFGNIDSNYSVDVNDVTTLQMYIAGLKELDALGRFHADTNLDNNISVEDVTHLQFELAK